MPTVVRIAAPLLFVVVTYCGWPLHPLIGYMSDAIPTSAWTALMFAAGAANLACALWLRREDQPRALAFWDLLLKLCLLPIFLETLLFAQWAGRYIFVDIGRFIMGFILMFPTFAAAYFLMLITSSYGFAAARRAREQELISADVAKTYIKRHALPIADLISAAKLYALLRDADSTHGEPPREA